MGSRGRKLTTTPSRGNDIDQILSDRSRDLENMSRQERVSYLEEMIRVQNYRTSQGQDTSTVDAIIELTRNSLNNETQTRRPLPASNVSVMGEDNYAFSNGRRPSGTGNWGFSGGGQEFWYNGKYSEAKKRAKSWAGKNGIGSIRVLT